MHTAGSQGNDFHCASQLQPKQFFISTMYMSIFSHGKILMLSFKICNSFPLRTTSNTSSFLSIQMLQHSNFKNLQVARGVTSWLLAKQALKDCFILNLLLLSSAGTWEHGQKDLVWSSFFSQVVPLLCPLPLKILLNYHACKWYILYISPTLYFLT